MAAICLVVTMGLPSNTLSDRTEAAAHIGAVIRVKRQERGLSASELARRANLALSYLSHLEHGDYFDIRLDKLARILEVLDLSADEVLQEAGYLPVKPRAPLPGLDVYLRMKLKLSPEDMVQALGFLDFLTTRAKRQRRRETA